MTAARMTTPLHTVDTLACDTLQLAEWRNNPDYDYGRELLQVDRSIWDGLIEWWNRLINRLFSKVFGMDDATVLIWCLCGLVLLILVLWYVYKKNPRFFIRSKAAAISYTVEEDTIYGVDFDKRIAEALARNDYRTAVRMVYLQTLKRLSDEGRIDWQIYKTPTEYVREISSADFRMLTHHFIRIRYGNFEASETLFNSMRTLQRDTLRKGGEP